MLSVWLIIKSVLSAAGLLLLVGSGLVMPWWLFLFSLFSLVLLSHCLVSR